MAVEIKYIVVREGQEKMAFTSKKDADAYDKMLDMAEVLSTWLQQSPPEMDDDKREMLALWMAENKDTLASIIKNGKLPSASNSEASLTENVSDHPARKKKDAA